MVSAETYLGPHVEYVLAAEFDIDSGPTVRYQYPTSIQGDKTLIAELMLPDQSHVRTEDWTIFFLYHQKNRSQLQYHIQNEQDKSKAEKLYVLNLVNTKFDKDVKRGAVVKAMCIVTPHPFFHVFKPLLLLALDEYFRVPSIDSLQALYDAINSIDLSGVPKLNFLERQILSASDSPDMFIEKFETDPHMSISSSPTLASIMSDRSSGYYIDLKSHAHIKRNLNQNTHFYESKVNFNGMKIPIKVPIDIYYESIGDFSMINLVSTFLNMKEPCQVLHPELTIYGAMTPPLLILINGLLTQKRILFVGLNRPSGEVSDRVLAACSLASGGVLRSFVTNAFPYTDLSKVDDLLSSKGYIAGVKNPAFGHHPSWWDIFVDLETGTLKISSAIGIPGPPISTKPNQQVNINNIMNPEDVSFIADLRSMIADHFAESSIRARCRDYIKRFIRIATNYEEFKYGRTNLWPSITDPDYDVVPGYGYTWSSEVQKMADFNCYAPVIEGWRTSRSYQCYLDDRAVLWPKSPKSVFDFDYYLDKLRYQKMSVEESAHIYTAISDHVRDDSDTMWLLTASSINKLFYIAYGLFHKHPQVRISTARLIHRIATHTAGRHFYESMSEFQKMAYRRIYQVDMEKTLSYTSSVTAVNS